MISLTFKLAKGRFLLCLFVNSDFLNSGIVDKSFKSLSVPFNLKD